MKTISVLKKYFLFCILLSLVLLLVAFPYRRKIKQKFKAYFGYTVKKHSGRSGNCLNCSEYFTDNVKKHNLAFVKDGLLPQNKDSDLDQLLKTGKLTKIETNSYYIVKKAQYSRPYMLPKGKLFINDLAKKYNEKCISEKLKFVPFTISSITRSRESVNKLMKNNNNAIEKSAHLKGKTFDVSYHDFHNNKKQSKAFIEALKELRNEKRCFVKFERNGCLHITVI